MDANANADADMDGDDVWNSKKSSASAGIGLSGVGSRRRGCHCHCQDHGDENLNLMRSLDGRRTSARFPQPTCHVSTYRTAMAMRRRADVRELPNHDSDKKTEDVPCSGIGRSLPSQAAPAEDGHLR